VRSTGVPNSERRLHSGDYIGREEGGEWIGLDEMGRDGTSTAGGTRERLSCRECCRQTEDTSAFMASTKAAISLRSSNSSSRKKENNIQLSGYPSVLGSLWQVRDSHSAEIAKDVYAWILADGGMDTQRSGEGLHRAIRTLRRVQLRDLL
jgi:CHAT domain